MLSLMLAAADAPPMDPLGHVLDKDVIGTGLFAITMNTLALVLAGILTVILTTYAARAIATGPETDGNKRFVTKGRFAQIFEVMVVYLRDDVIRPQLGDEWRKWTPFLLSCFFFILTCNFLGLVPLIDLQYLIGKSAVAFFGYEGYYKDFKVIGGTPTGRWTTTLALSCVAFVVWTVHGITSMGVKGFFGHFTGGVPKSLWPLWVIMIPVEIIGTFVKPAALTIRLFANMTAGHILLAAMIGLSGLSVGLLGAALGGFGTALGLMVSVVATAVSIAIFFLEVFVALLQAYIFTFLTTIFIAQMSHHHGHDHDEEHELEAELEHTPELLGHARGV